MDKNMTQNAVWNRVLMARHQKRPTAKVLIEYI